MWHVNTAAAARPPPPAFTSARHTQGHRGASLCERRQCGSTGKYHHTSLRCVARNKFHLAAHLGSLRQLAQRWFLGQCCHSSLNAGWPDQHMLQTPWWAIILPRVWLTASGSPPPLVMQLFLDVLFWSQPKLKLLWLCCRCVDVYMEMQVNRG